jgi:hypothetical protein
MSTGVGVLNVSAAAGATATLSFYKGTAIAGTTTATSGTLIGTWTFTVVPASTSGTYNAANSSIFVQPAIAKGGTSSTTQAFDSTSRITNGGVGVIYVSTKDAYLGTVTGALTATATNGATVLVTNSNVAAADSYSSTSSFASEASFDGAGYVVVNQPTANTASSTTVTITLDGEVIATKTLNWNGIAASIALIGASSASIFSNPTTYTGDATTPAGANLNIAYVVKDAAGNVLTLTDHPTITSQTGAMVGASLSTGDQTGTAAAGTIDSIIQTSSLGYGAATMLVPSSTLNGAGTYKLKYVNSVGTSLTSDEIKATVSGAVNSFSVSWDKAVYTSGEIATLTITAKDSKGNLVADGVALGSGSLVTVNTDGLQSVTSACDSANIATTTYLGGSKVCKFAVKNTAGAYAYTAVVANATAQSAAAGTITVSAGTAVSNADVLKAIVSLIASINKQIAALQKALLRR